jgi:eukaryotic-like serine/threonine-protein kinase
MDTQVADLPVGALVAGRYRVRGRAARRGAVSVYSAVDERLERAVALKVVHPAPPAGFDAAERFGEQARAISGLTHPGLVACYDQGTHNGLPYLVLEHVPGRSLRDVLATRGQLRPTEALAILEQMLAAMAAAHRAGLVHRDIKPEHVLIAESPSGGVGNLVDCVVKVADFGLAQAVRAATAGPDSGPLATVAYVAPELVTDGHADARSDVYAAGIVLFEMLTGQVPHQGRSPEEVAWQHVDRDVPPPSTYAFGVPPALDDLVLRATRRDPGARPTDAGALLAEAQVVKEAVTTTTAAPATGPAADHTVVMKALPATDRPAWARLPAPRPTRATERAWSDTGGIRPARRDPLADRRRRQILIAAGAVLALLVLVGAWWFGFGRWMPAPDLVAMTEQEAVTEAARLGLDVRYAPPRHSEQVAEGLVLAQEPDRNGRVTRGGTMVLTLSLGSEVRQVPNIIGAEFEVAQRQLEEMGLVVREGERGYSNTVPAGRVLAVVPEVGSDVRPGDEVEVSVSRGRAPIEVPYLIGMDINQASSELHQRGLQVEVVDVESTRPKNEVVGQEPGAGSGVEEGDTVRLEVSEGPPTVPVPDVDGERCGRAVDIVLEAGFDVVVPLGERGRVHRQDPSAGTGLPPGSRVTIWCL